MTWVAYRITFRVLTPLHIGWRKLGNLHQTRPYVTGQALWGALTARLVREQAQSDYQRVGDLVDKELALTYLYPTTTLEPEKVLWPWSKEQRDSFAWTFLGSYASTALANGRNAEDASLHETEFIAPYTRSKNDEQGTAPTYLVGYIFARETSQLEWQSALRRVQFGGERSYGWGRVCLEECVFEGASCFGYALNCAADRPQITVKARQALLAHTIATSAHDYTGSLEPFIGRETSTHGGFGKAFSDARICWAPGSCVSETSTFQIGSRGIWV